MKYIYAKTSPILAVKQDVNGFSKMKGILQSDRSVVIKPAGKRSTGVVWDRTDHLKEAERQLSDEKNLQRN